MFERILVATDFSAPSDAALDLARTFRSTFGGSLHLLHVTADALVPPHVMAQQRENQLAAVKELRSRLGPDDRGHTTIRIVERANPAEAIRDYARTAGIDLIVMGTHGRGGVAHFLLGSVAEAVVRKASCPVLTVREPGAQTASFTRILVPTDFSGPSDAALDHARMIAERFGATIHLLHVIEEHPVTDPFGSELFISEQPEIRATRLDEARERLSHRLSSWDRTHGRITKEVIFGRAAQTIVDYASDNGFDLIVMGTHGRTGLAHLLMGSVAERVVRTATCPVVSTHTGGLCPAVAAEPLSVTA